MFLLLVLFLPLLNSVKLTEFVFHSLDLVCQTCFVHTMKCTSWSTKAILHKAIICQTVAVYFTNRYNVEEGEWPNLYCCHSFTCPRYPQYACVYFGCNNHIRTYCACHPGVWLCGTCHVCHVCHVLEEQESANWVSLVSAKSWSQSWS